MKNPFIIKPLNKWNPNGVYGIAPQPKNTMLFATELVNGVDVISSMKITDGVTPYKNLKELLITASISQNPNQPATEIISPISEEYDNLIYDNTIHKFIRYSDNTIIDLENDYDFTNVKYVKLLISVNTDTEFRFGFAKPSNEIYISPTSGGLQEDREFVVEWYFSNDDVFVSLSKSATGLANIVNEKFRKSYSGFDEKLSFTVSGNIYIPKLIIMIQR